MKATKALPKYRIMTPKGRQYLKYVDWFYDAYANLKAGGISASEFRRILVDRWGYDEDEALEKMAELGYTHEPGEVWEV